MKIVSLDLDILAPHTATPFTFQTLPDSNFGETFDGNTVSEHHAHPTSAHAGQEDFDTARVTATMVGKESPIWSAVPRYTTPTTSIDRLIASLIETRRLNYEYGAGIREFSYKNFPSVNSLLNPSAVEPDEPVASAIAKHVMGVIRVHTLPEKLAVG